MDLDEVELAQFDMEQPESMEDGLKRLKTSFSEFPCLQFEVNSVAFLENYRRHLQSLGLPFNRACWI